MLCAEVMPICLSGDCQVYAACIVKMHWLFNSEKCQNWVNSVIVAFVEMAFMYDLLFCYGLGSQLCECIPTCSPSWLAKSC